MELCDIGPFKKCGTFTPRADDWVPFTVVFTLAGGGDSDRRSAAERGLKVGHLYEVESIEVGDWYSYLRLKGFDGTFNTVMFEQEASSGGARSSYPSEVAGRLRRCGVSPSADNRGFKGTGDDCSGLYVGPVLKGVMITLLATAAVCLNIAFFKGLKGPVGWRDIVTACVVSAAAVCGVQALLRLVVGRHGRG